MGVKHEVVSARTLRRVVNEQEKRLANDLEAIRRVVTEYANQTMCLRDELKAAIERKPSAILAQLVYQLRTTRAELALVQETLEKNTAVIERYVALMEAPTLGPVTGIELIPIREG